jgi:hypothetical protein
MRRTVTAMDGRKMPKRTIPEKASFVPLKKAASKMAAPIPSKNENSIKNQYSFRRARPEKVA